MSPNRLLSKFQRKSTTDAGGTPEADEQAAARKPGLISRLIGCSHKNLSRPFIEGKTAYKSCLDCGARKQFDPETFESYGTFYYPSAGRS